VKEHKLLLLGKRNLGKIFVLKGDQVSSSESYITRKALIYAIRIILLGYQKYTMLYWRRHMARRRKKRNACRRMVKKFLGKTLL
jgi:hypothetical protein